MANSFTTQYSGRASSLSLACGISPFDPLRPDHAQPAYTKFKALWDTGATLSAVSERVWDRLKLEPVKRMWIQDANERRLCNASLVNLRLINQIAFLALTVTVQKLRGIDILIGLDVIASGDFAISSIKGNTVVSFRYPSTGKIDLVRKS